MMHIVAREVFRLLLGNKAKVSLFKGPLSRMYLAVVTCSLDLMIISPMLMSPRVSPGLFCNVQICVSPLFSKRKNSSYFRHESGIITLASSVRLSHILGKVDIARCLKVRSRRKPPLNLAVPYMPSYHAIEGGIIS